MSALTGGARLSSVAQSVATSVGEMGTAYLGSGVLDDAWENLSALIERDEPDYAS